MALILRRRAQFSSGIAGTHGCRPGGHNYLCELSVSGNVDPITGMVVNIKDIDHIMRDRITARFDGKILDADVPPFTEAAPTLENLTCEIWRLTVDQLPAECSLHGAALWQTQTYWATALPSPDRDRPMIRVTRAYDFSASHRLHAAELSDAENDAIFGKCNWPNGHGHNYEIEITMAGEPDPLSGELFAPSRLDAIVEQVVLKPFDHRHLNFDVPEFRDLVPTSENVTVVIWNRIAARLKDEPFKNAELFKVVVRETARNYFEYCGPESP